MKLIAQVQTSSNDFIYWIDCNSTIDYLKKLNLLTLVESTIDRMKCNGHILKDFYYE